MHIYVDRKEPSPPPITQVVINLSKEEAKSLVTLFGKLSISKVGEVLHINGVNPLTEKIYNLTAGIYFTLTDEEGMEVDD